MAGCPEAWDLDIDGRYPDGSFPDDDYRSGGYDHGWVEQSIPKKPLYSFNSLEELTVSEVFQNALTQALAHKDKTIRELQEELMSIDSGNSGMC